MATEMNKNRITCRRGVHDDEDVRKSESPTLETSNLNSRSPRPVRTPMKKNASDHDSESESELEDEQKTSRCSSLKQSDPSPPIPTQGSPLPRKPLQMKNVQLESYSVPNAGTNQTQSSSNLKWIAIAILLILPTVVFSNIFVLKSGTKTCKFDQLRQNVPSLSSEVWNALTINIEKLLNKMSKSPNIYLLMHSNESNNEQIQKLIKDIALETSKCFGK